jgi:Zn-finger nucleic acid-binding protein
VKCPLDHYKLVSSLYEGETVYHCTYCDGNLIFKTSLFQILHKKEKKFLNTIKEKALKLKRIEAPERRLLKCPHCGKNMDQINFSLNGEIFLDVCVCGAIWFDLNELESVQAFFEYWQTELSSKDNKMGAKRLALKIMYSLMTEKEKEQIGADKVDLE